MAAAAEDNDQPELGDAVAGRSRWRRKKLLLIIGAAVIVLAVGGGAAAYFTGLLTNETAASGSVDPAATAGQPVAVSIPAEPVFYALPDLVVTLNSGDRKPRYLKTVIKIAVDSDADISRIERLQPRIVDFCQLYLRELRPDELRGSIALIRMREELLRRINAAIQPTVAREVLFTDLFIE